MNSRAHTNLLYFSPVSRQHFSKPQILAELVNARGVYVEFGREDVRAPDVYFYPLPNAERVIKVTGDGNLKRRLRELRGPSLGEQTPHSTLSSCGSIGS